MTRRVGLAWDGTAIAVCRIGMGIAGLFAPARLQRASLLHDDDVSVRIWTRFWATRAIGLGIGYLTADEPTRRHLIRVGFLVDALDTAFLLSMSARRETPKPAVLWLASLTALATAGDLAEMRAGRHVRQPGAVLSNEVTHASSARPANSSPPATV